MNSFPDIQAQVQVAHWGWDIAVFLWLVGLSGMGTLAYVWVRRGAVAVMSLVTVLAGLAVVFSHLSRWWNLPAALFHAVTNLSFNFASWMMLGIAFLSVQAALCLVLAWHHLAPAYPLLQRIPVVSRLVDALARMPAFVVACGVSGVAVTIYSGFLLAAANGVPLWNTALLPILWVFSAGVAVLALLELFHLLGWVDRSVAQQAMKVALAADAMKLVMLFAFISVALTTGSAGARAGATVLVAGSLAPMLWIGVIGLGVLVPMGANVYALRGGHVKALAVAAAVLAILGGLLLRASVLMAGQFETLAF